MPHEPLCLLGILDQVHCLGDEPLLPGEVVRVDERRQLVQADRVHPPGKIGQRFHVLEKRLAVLDHQVLIVAAQRRLDQHGAGDVGCDPVGDHAADVFELLAGGVLLL